MNDIFNLFTAGAIGCAIGIQICIFMLKLSVYKEIDSLVDLASKKLLNQIKAAVLRKEMEADDESETNR